MRAAEESVSSGWRIAGSVLVGLFLLAGQHVAWGLVPELPYSGWATGELDQPPVPRCSPCSGGGHRRVRAARRGSPTAT